MVILKLLVFCLILVFHLLNDYTRINKDLKINHIITSFVRIVIFIICSYAESKSFIIGLQWFINLNLFYWLWFDLLLNYLRNKPINYIGKEAFTDKLLRLLKIKNITIFKIILILITNIIFLFI